MLERVKDVVKQSDNPEITLQFNRLEQALKQQGHVTEKVSVVIGQKKSCFFNQLHINYSFYINFLLKTLDQQLLEEINRTVFNQQQGREFQNAATSQRQFRPNNQRRPRDQGFVQQRPGLSELV